MIMNDKIPFLILLASIVINAQNLSIKKYWNLFGATDNISLSSFKSTCVEKAFSYKGNKQWNSYPKDSSFTSINIGQGFWTYSTTDCEVDTNAKNDIISNKSPNILLIIADDVGLDSSLGYDIGAIKPKMPNVQNLINTGITFENVWASSTCTPTRGNILTGKYSSKTNTLNVGDELSTNEVSLQKYIKNNSATAYNSAVIGKWHLSSDENHPINMGVGKYAGLLSGGVRSYDRWKLTQDGKTTVSKEYITTKFTDLAIDFVSNQDKPWFLWLAYTSAHTPFHLPPKNLHTQDLSGDEMDIIDNPRNYYMAMLEAMDTEIGRLLSSLSAKEKDRTIIIFIGDNGTPNEVRQEFEDGQVKGSIYEGGVHIPMIIAGAGVSRKNEKENALINITDLYSTIANLSGVSNKSIHNSQSFFDLLSDKNANTRDYIYAEVGKKSGGMDFAIRNKNYKYISFARGKEAFFDLRSDILEKNNIIDGLSNEQKAIKDEFLLNISKGNLY